MFIEKIQLSGAGNSAPVSLTFQKGIFLPDASVPEGVDIARVLTFFFYGAQSLSDGGSCNLSGALYFCENSLHYRINATPSSSSLYKITAVGEEQIELEDNMTFGEALFGVGADTFYATLGFGVYDNQNIAQTFTLLMDADAASVGIYDFMNRIRSAANKGSADKSEETEVIESLEDTIVISDGIAAVSDPLEATRVMENDSPELFEGFDDVEFPEQTIKIAPAPDLEIEASEVRIRQVRRQIDQVTEQLEEVSKKAQIGRMSDLASKIEDYKEKKSLYEGALERKRLYEDTYRAGTIELPDNAYVNELQYAVDEITSCEAELRDIHNERESIDPDHNNNKLSNLYIKVEDDGGIETIRQKLQKLAGGKRIYMLSSIFFAIAGVILILAGAVISLLPVYKTMFIAGSPFSVAHAGMFVLTVGIASLVPALTCISGMQSMHEHTLELFADYGCEGEKSTQSFLNTLENAINESEEKKERLEKLRAVEKKVAACQSRVNEGQRIIREHLTIWDRAFDSRLSYCENAMNALLVAREFLSEYEVFKNDAERARAAYDEAGYFIMGFEDRIFDEDFDPTAYKMSQEEIDACDAVCEQLKQTLNSLYDELDDLKDQRDELVFAQKTQKAQKARPEPDEWLCELVDKFEVIANNENSNAWHMAIARAQYMAYSLSDEPSDSLFAALVMLASFETFYEKVMPPQLIRVSGDKQKFAKEIESVASLLVSNQIIIY